MVWINQVVRPSSETSSDHERHHADSAVTHTGGKEAETQNVGSKSCVLPFQRDASVGDSQIFVIIPCDGWNLRSWRTVGNLHFRHLSRRFFSRPVRIENGTWDCWTKPRSQAMVLVWHD